MPCVETCTPSQSLDVYKCAACLSESELKAVLALALGEAAGLTVQELLDCSSCYTCMSKKQLMQTIVTKIGYNYLSRYTIPEIREQIKCLLCAPPQLLDAAIAYGVCAYYDA